MGLAMLSRYYKVIHQFTVAILVLLKRVNQHPFLYAMLIEPLMPLPRFAVYNPSIVAHNDGHILLTRSSTNAHCHGATDVDMDLSKFSYDSR